MSDFTAVLSETSGPWRTMGEVVVPSLRGLGVEVSGRSGVVCDSGAVVVVVVAAAIVVVVGGARGPVGCEGEMSGREMVVC